MCRISATHLNGPSCRWHFSHSNGNQKWPNQWADYAESVGFVLCACGAHIQNSLRRSVQNLFCSWFNQIRSGKKAFDNGRVHAMNNDHFLCPLHRKSSTLMAFIIRILWHPIHFPPMPCKRLSDSEFMYKCLPKHEQCLEPWMDGVKSYSVTSSFIRIKWKESRSVENVIWTKRNIELNDILLYDVSVKP